MQTQIKLFKNCKEYKIAKCEGQEYYKIPIVYYMSAYNTGEMFNAVNAITGELTWIDGFKKVEVIAE